MDDGISLLGKLLRNISKLRFKILNLSTIKDIPTDQFNSIIEKMIQQPAVSRIISSAPEADGRGGHQRHQGNGRRDAAGKQWGGGSVEEYAPSQHERDGGHAECPPMPSGFGQARQRLPKLVSGQRDQ